LNAQLIANLQSPHTTTAAPNRRNINLASCKKLELSISRTSLQYGDPWDDVR
jgi:hypothetical protein